MLEDLFRKLSRGRPPTIDSSDLISLARERLANRTLFLNEISAIKMVDEYLIYPVLGKFDPERSLSQENLPDCYIAIINTPDEIKIRDSDLEELKSKLALIDSIAANHKNKMPDTWEFNHARTRLSRSFAFDR